MGNTEENTIKRIEGIITGHKQWFVEEINSRPEAERVITRYYWIHDLKSVLGMRFHVITDIGHTHNIKDFGEIMDYLYSTPRLNN